MLFLFKNPMEEGSAGSLEQQGKASLLNYLYHLFKKASLERIQWLRN